MRWEVISRLGELGSNPKARSVVKDAEVIVELHDDQKAVSVVFSPYQAFRITTADCFYIPDGFEIVHRAILEVHDSAWIRELKAALFEVDEGAAFLTRSRHFLIPSDDHKIEVVAWNYSIKTTCED